MSPLVKYVVRKQVTRPLITLLIIGSLASTSFTIAAAGATIRGLQRTFAATGSPERVVVLSKDADVQTASNITLDQFQQVAANPEVKRSSGEQVFQAWLPHASGDGGDFVDGRGLDEVGIDMYGAKITSGRLPGKGQREVIIGSILAARYGYLKLGSTIAVASKAPCEIVGVFHTGTSHDGEIFASRATIMNETKTTDPSFALLETSSAQEATALAERINSRKVLELNAIIEANYYGSIVGRYRPIIYSIFVVLILVFIGSGLAAFGGLSLIFAQRVGDLAVVRALGFRNRFVIWWVVSEAQMLAMVSAVVGLAVAFVLVHGYAAYITSVGLSVVFRTLITPDIVILAFVILGVIGLIAASFPLVRVMRSEIKDALRE